MPHHFEIYSCLAKITGKSYLALFCFTKLLHEALVEKLKSEVESARPQFQTAAPSLADLPQKNGRKIDFFHKSYLP